MPTPPADPYDTKIPLWLYRARGVHVEDRSGHHVTGGCELFAADDDDARAQVARLFRGGLVEVERLPLPAVEPPGFGDDAQRVRWSAARQAWQDGQNRRYWAERAAAAGVARAA